ncbi:MAG: diaminopimelate epimerase [Bacteroidales bacterium]|nr:diaminopimelate epimerase [Bacteroidales bacterium]
MKILFNKYHGTGNDFIMIDNRESQINGSDSGIIAKMCNRHFGIGADGLILIEKDSGEDFRMKYFNADGKEATMCGNGGRCAVAFAAQLGIISDKGTFTAADGVHRASINSGVITLGMNNTKLPDERGEYLFLDTGSPHIIVETGNCDDIDVDIRGRELRWSEQFAPEGVNVNFMEKIKDGTIMVRTYERGVEAETLSCGTGVTAAAIASCYGSGPGKYSIDIITRGGKLSVGFTIKEGRASEITLTGDTRFVFEGIIDTSLL